MGAALRPKPEALAIAGYSAPRLRGQPEAVRMRRIAKTDQDGNVVGYTTLEEVQKALLRRQEIEFDVADGVRPKKIVCRHCGKLVATPKKGGPVPVCCASCRHYKCADCGAETTERRSNRRDSVRCMPCRRTFVACKVTLCAGCKNPCKKLGKKSHAIPRCRPCRKLLTRRVAVFCACGKQLSDDASYKGSTRCLPCWHKMRRGKPKGTRANATGATTKGAQP